jgi:UPF0755 protein
MRRGRRWQTGCLAVIFLALCGLTVAGGLAWYIPRVVENNLGPANTNLGPAQRMVIAWQLFFRRDDLARPLNPAADKMSFTVRLGESANSVSARLEEDRIVRDGELFRLYLVYTGLDTTIQAGEYQLSGAESVKEIASELQDATPKEVEFNILPGWRAEEIAAALPTSGLEVSPQGLLQLVISGSSGQARTVLGVDGSLEGFLLPGSYRFLREARAEDLLNGFTARFAEQVDGEMRAAFEANGLSLRDAVILASIVQREAVLEEEQPIIASVFYNRLADGMALESDPTVQYALGYNQEHNTWWTNPLSGADLAVDSPYNTYRYGGLPPGPISNPSLSALRAVAYPAQTPYYYFRAACDQSGKHAFALTYDEHVANACQ